MLRQNSSCINWHLLLVGLFFVILRCDARAVNVSNTWTMPQEGLNVFYRFFRDRISWFEADAVCQFHHANLVTVDNSFQFDATRDLLRELDVNDIVWIGLMRPQSSDRFMWSTSRPLVADTGYWAESLPLMDAPLCAVIDPIRDYRWHALRCGGPETASFLCEMPVPIWADACNLKDMPNLTLQYMADTASIELIRNCQEEGLLRTMCRGKQDRERAMQDLVCPRERLEAQRINDITNSHFKSLQIINSIPTDNNENNDIELMPLEVNYGPHYPEELQTEKNTVQRLIEQFNVDELMQADEPSNMETVSSFYKIPGLIPKPVKKSAKKVLDYPKEDNGKQQNSGMSGEKLQKDQKRLPLIMEEMMMGDQPLQGEPEIPEQFLNEEVSNEILEPLPHIKKTNIHKEDGLEKMEKEAIALKKNMQKNKEMEIKKLFMMSMATTTTTTPITESETAITTSTPNKPILISKTTTETHLTSTSAVSTIKTEEMSKQKEEYAQEHYHETNQKNENAGAQLSTVTSPSIGHPIHPQQPRSNVITEESQHSHTKEIADNSHFIPPMLMVKSHYIPPASKHGHSEHDHHYHHNQQQQQHEAEKSQVENTTKEQTATTLKQEQNQTFEMVTIMPTTSKVLDSKKTTLTTLDTLKSNRENGKKFAVTRQEENQAALTTTETDSSMKPITEEHTTDTEQRKNSKILYFEEKQTTMTATTLQPDASTSEKYIADDEMTLLATNSEKINKNIAGHGIKEEEISKFKLPQKTQTDDDTNPTTEAQATTEKSLTFTEKLYNLETTTDYREKTEAIADDMKTVQTLQQEQAQPQQQHELTREEKLTAIKTQEHKEHVQTTTGTTEKQAATQTAKVITTSTTVSTLTTQQTAETTTKPEAQNLQQIKEEQANKENLQEKEDTIVKTTEIQITTTSALTEAKEDDTKTTKTTTSTAYTPTITTSITTTTTVKPITTISPQNEVKSTDISFSSTNAITSTTTNLPTTTVKDICSTTTTTIMPPTSTSSSIVSLVSSPVTITKTLRETKTESTTATATSTQAPTSMPPETTRNFLKVTTEIPFKPNRRRSLTKPETVSYMKKILG